ncbi:hypothetical protein RSAG8_08622, partial [Rhizoctonia solani AG-8 WAC10335]
MTYHSPRLPVSTRLSTSVNYYFTTLTNITTTLRLTTGIYEAEHIRELLLYYADKHNDHPSPYSEYHPDPLERRIHQYPDVEHYSFGGLDAHWYVGVHTCHALNGAYFHALQAFGDALQPDKWNRREPWLYYDFDAALARLGMQPLPRPHTFHQGLYHVPFESFTELQRTVHRNNFFAMCLFATAYVVNAVKMNHFHNLAYAGYMRGSPGFVSAHRHWCRVRGYPVLDRSQDDDSAAGEFKLSNLTLRLKFTSGELTDFDALVQEQWESVDALAASSPAAPDTPMEEDEPERPTKAIGG